MMKHTKFALKKKTERKKFKIFWRKKKINEEEKTFLANFPYFSFFFVSLFLKLDDILKRKEWYLYHVLSHWIFFILILGVVFVCSVLLFKKILRNKTATTTTNEKENETTTNNKVALHTKYQASASLFLFSVYEMLNQLIRLKSFESLNKTVSLFLFISFHFISNQFIHNELTSW